MLKTGDSPCETLDRSGTSRVFWILFSLPWSKAKGGNAKRMPGDCAWKERTDSLVMSRRKYSQDSKIYRLAERMWVPIDGTLPVREVERNSLVPGGFSPKVIRSRN